MFGAKKEEHKCTACVGGEGDHSCIEHPEEYAGGSANANKTISEIQQEPLIACKACEGLGAEHTCM